MPPLPLKLGAFDRTDLPEVACVNMLAEPNPTSETFPMMLIARFGLATFATVGTAPIRGVFQRDGIFDGDAIILAQETLHRLSADGVVTAFTGTVAGDDLVVIDAGLDNNGDSVVRIATGSAMYKATGTNVVAETFPDSGNAGATSVAFLSGYWIGTEVGTDFAYYIEPGGSTWTPLEFAAAEYRPDKLKGVVVVGEIAWLMGDSTLEGWRATGDAASPLAPAGGLKFDVGTKTIHAAVNCRGVLIFVDNDGSVRMMAGADPAVISGYDLAQQIRETSAADIRASFFTKDQHPLYILTLGESATWAYDLGTRVWTRMESDGETYWKADLFANIGDTVIARDATSSVIYTLDPDLATDAGETFTCYFSAFIPALERPVPVANVMLDCEVGGSPRSGQGSDPLIGLQWSRNGGKTYSGLRFRGLGATGEYRTRVRWNALGQADAPWGMWLRWQVSDPVRRRFSGAMVNV
jgi:hypothetical protein